MVTFLLFSMGRCPKPRRSVGQIPTTLPAGSDFVALSMGRCPHSLKHLY